VAGKYSVRRSHPQRHAGKRALRSSGGPLIRYLAQSWFAPEGSSFLHASACTRVPTDVPFHLYPASREGPRQQLEHDRPRQGRSHRTLTLWLHRMDKEQDPCPFLFAQKGTKKGPTIQAADPPRTASRTSPRWAAAARIVDSHARLPADMAGCRTAVGALRAAYRVSYRKAGAAQQRGPAYPVSHK
jgi:hypothetical protein